MVGNAGVIKTEVVLVAHKARVQEDTRWVFLDIGKFGGLAETMDEAIRDKIISERDGDVIPTILAGPTCDSADVLYEKTPMTYRPRSRTVISFISKGRARIPPLIRPFPSTASIR